jgi:hypothetical protein
LLLFETLEELGLNKTRLRKVGCRGGSTEEYRHRWGGGGVKVANATHHSKVKWISPVLQR